MSELLDFCQHLVFDSPEKKYETDPVGKWIMQPEYSAHMEEIKPYPLSKKERLFALCWEMKSGRHMHASVLPCAERFCYECSFPPSGRTQLHTHEYIELSYIADGEFSQKIMGKDIIFKKGDFCLIDKNCSHQDYVRPGSATVIFLGISNEIFQEIIGYRITDERIASFLHSALLRQKNLQQYLHFRPRSSDSAKIEAALLTLLKELELHDAASYPICVGLLLRIFLCLDTDYDIQLSSEMRRKMNWLLFQEITDYMNAHLNDISIRRLVEEFHFQEDYFNRLFKKRTGLTYTEYLQRLRLERAEYLLRNTSMSIDDIAHEIGYHNKGYFYKIFTERHRITPAQFRKKNLQ